MTAAHPVPVASASRVFDPAFPGTDEHEWEMALSEAEDLILPEADILVVSPHPDDETLGAGGFIREAAHGAHPVTVLCVTDGEAAYPDWKGLRRIRRRETNRALTILAPHPVTIRRLSLPDGQLSRHRGALAEAVDRLASSTTLLVAPFERDGHPDHEATGEVCIEVARRRALRVWRYPIWTWHHNTPDRLRNLAWGRFWLNDDTRRTKRLAIDCFASQLRPEARKPIMPAHVLPYFSRPFEAFLL